jgi:CelD/BcsL family acetyltransferase involved in cellulose biosynthesis
MRLYAQRFGEPELAVATSGAEVEDWFGEMVTLHAATWRARGESGAFADSTVREFHLGLLRSSVGAAAADGLVAEIIRVRFGSQVTGYLYNLRYRGRVSFYQSGLAYHDDNRLKSGLVAHTLAVEHYLAQGENEYDFLGGEPESVRYKTSLSTDKRMLAWAELPSPTAKMRLLRGLRLARRRARALLQGA